jgi:cell wall-associated NlpC family hydrolase
MPSLVARFGVLRLALVGIALLAMSAGASAVLVSRSQQTSRSGSNVISLDRSPTQLAARGPAAKATLAGVGDSEAAQAYVQTRAQVGNHPKARSPHSASATTGISPGAPSDAEVRRELKQLQQYQSGAGLVAGALAKLGSNGLAQAPRSAPAVVRRVIAGGNEIADFPYIWGGGHGSFVDNGYDCSGSVSYALAAAGLLKSPLTSGAFMRWGAPGPGRWITIEASNGHVYMYVAGLRFDTSGRSGPRGSRWQTARRSNAGFVAVHPPGF